MMFNSINPIFVGGPVVAGLGLLGLSGWRREKARQFEEAKAAEEARRNALLLDACRLRPDWQTWKRAQGRGQIAILAVGTYAANLLPAVLEQFERAGAADYVGFIYLLELDQAHRAMCLHSIPAQFRLRVVEATCPNFPGGMLAAPVEAVLAQQELWRPDVMDKAQAWLARIQRESAPVFLLVLLSPGGMAALGRPVVEAFRWRYPDKPVYVVSILDDKTAVRQRFPDVRRLYSQDSLVRGYILTDNRRFKRRSDAGIALLFAGMAASTWISDQPLDPWNALTHVFDARKRPGRLATVSVWAETLPVYHLPAWRDVLPEVFYTQASLFEEKAMRGIRAVVEHPELQGLPLEPAPPGNTRVVCVAAPIVPKPDFQLRARRIEQALEAWRAKTDPDLSIQYASIATPMSPETQEVPIFAVLLQPLKATAEQVDALALGAPVAPRFLPGPRRPRQIAAKATKHSSRR